MKSLVCLLLAALFLVPIVSATEVSFDPPIVNIDSGSTFNITIWVIPTQMIDTVATNSISWDADALTCLSVEHGSLFNDTTIWLPGTINNLKGTIVNSLWASAQPTDVAGSYIMLSFRAKSSTSLSIDVSGCGIARNGTDVPKTVHDTCVVTVDGGSVLPDVADNQTMLYVIILFCIVLGICVIVALLSRRKKKE